MQVNDFDIRQQALDINQSFIIQAPAGSGKTTLLTQRFMQLIKANIPINKLLAITFTKKAADEMQNRVNQELINLQHKHANTNLPIMTFDAFCHNINQHQSPDSTIHNFPKDLYLLAINDLLDNDNKVIQQHIAIIADYLAGNIKLMHSFFITLLEKRDQWLLWLLKNQKTNHTNQTGCWIAAKQHSKLILEQLDDLDQLQILQILQYINQNSDHLNSIKNIPKTIDHNQENGILLLQHFCKIALKSNHDWRQKVDVRQGFVASSQCKTKQEKIEATQAKNIFLDIINNLSKLPDLKIYLVMLKSIPLTDVDFVKNDIMPAIQICLPNLIAHFKVRCNINKQHDFLESSIQLVDSLNTEDHHTAEMINQIEHVLIDEAQDTSWIQYQILTSLTQNWQQDDSRSLFIVGDPSQSIYKFRQAQVSLFEHIRLNGINNLKLKAIFLTSNFRSNQTIVNWVNQLCHPIFPTKIDFSLGAISYHPSTATKSSHGKINYLWLENASIQQQTQELTLNIQQKLQSNPHFKCAILLRSRTHAATLLTQLIANDISFYADSLKPIMQSQIIIDLLTLTQAINNQYDTSKWCALLRSPWFGMSLSEISLLTNNNNNILDNIYTYSEGFSIFNNKCAKACYYLVKACQKSTYMNLAEVIKQLWHQLESPKTLKSSIEFSACELFFNILTETINQSGILAVNDLELKLNNIYIDQLTAKTTKTATCQIMTIHKAKGLEFDHVYLPFLCQAHPKQHEQLLWWHNLIDDTNQHHCLLSPAGSINSKETLTAYLKIAEKQKNHFESIRLFYVAITRAKHEITLIGSINADNSLINNNSLLATIWPHLPNTKAKKPSFKNTDENNNTDLPIITNYLPITKKHQLKQFAWNTPSYDFNNYKFCQKTFGDLAHKTLELLTTNLRNQSKDVLYRHLMLYLKETNTPLALCYHYLKELSQLEINWQKQKVLSWILQPHLVEYSELDIILEEKWYRIDRIFVDNGITWIIDYKTGNLTGNQANFKNILFNKHAKQLNKYADYFPNQPCNLGIYHLKYNTWVFWKKNY